jgi:hypothetical protein
MLRSMKELKGYELEATDDKFGRLDDLLFDDETWVVRYLVANTGNWLSDRSVLISPFSVTEADGERKRLMVSLSREQIENAPAVSKARPVSRKMEEMLARHYGWARYWSPPMPGAVDATGAPIPSPAQVGDTEGEDSETVKTGLRSLNEVVGYHIQAADGEIGHVEEFIGDDEAWVIRYMVVDTRNWLPGRKVLVSPVWIDRVSWADAKVYVDASRNAVKESPEYHPDEPINRAYEQRLYDYYGRPVYWKK